MPLYFSAHPTACLTKQAISDLMKQLLASTEVQVRRCVASQIGGRLLIETIAADQKTLERWLEAHHVYSEWIIRIELEATDGNVKEC